MVVIIIKIFTEETMFQLRLEGESYVNMVKMSWALFFPATGNSMCKGLLVRRSMMETPKLKECLCS